MDDKMKQIPAFTVLKNGSILKNIFLLHKSSLEDSDSVDEQILLVGRHPNCNITLEHPSISRYHLRIHSDPSSRSLYIVDLSSVHGTWVSGKKIEPGVNVRLKEGDTVKLGGSSRVYVLHWVPASEAYDHNGQFAPVIYTIKEGEDETNQDEKLETRSWDDDLECSDISLSSKSHGSPVTKLNPFTFSGQSYLSSVCDDAEIEQLSLSCTGNENDETLGTISVKSPSVVSGTKSVIDQLHWLNDNLSNEFKMVSYETNKDDMFWAPSCSKSSCDDTEAEQLSKSCTSNEKGESSGTVSVKSPSVVSGTKSVIDQLDWLNDNLSNEFEMLSYGTNKDDMFWVPSSSKSSCTSNQNSEIFAKVSVQSQLVVPESIPAREIYSNLNKSEDQMNWLKDDLNSEFELQSHRITKEDVFSGAGCSSFSSDDTNVEGLSPSKTGNGNGEIFSTMLVKPSLTSETISMMEESNSLNKSFDLLDWLKDNLSNEFELQNYEAVKEDEFSVAECWKTGYENITVPVQSSLVVPVAISETESCDSRKKLSDQLHWLRDNLSNEFELQNQTIIKQDVFCLADSLSSSSDDTEVEQLTPSKTGNGNAGLFSTVCVEPSLVSETNSAARISDDLKIPEDKRNWLSDNLSNEFVLQNNGIAKDLFSGQSYSYSSCHDTEVDVSEISDSLNRSKDEMNWLRDNLNNEFAPNNCVSEGEDSFSGPNCTKSSCDVTELEPSIPWETCEENGSVYAAVANEAPLVSEFISVKATSDSLNKSEDQLNWLRDNLSIETFATVSIQAPLVGSEAISEEEISDSLYKSEDWMNWLRDNLCIEFEQLSYDTMKDARISSEKHEKDSSNQDIARSIESDMCNESETINQQKVDNCSVPMALLDGVNKDGDVSFQPSRAGEAAVNTCCKFEEEMERANTTDVSIPVVLVDDLQSQVDDICVECESIDHEIMKKESVSVVPLAETCTDQKEAFTPDAARAKEVPIDLEALKNGSVLMNPLDSLDGNKFEIFTPDKENKDPKAYSVKSSKKRWMEDEHNISSHHTISKTAVRTPTVDEEKYIFNFPAETKNVFMQKSLNVKDMADPLVYYDEAFLSNTEKETESRQGKMEGSLSSINFSQTVQKAIDSTHNFLGGSKENWIMIVDIGSLLNAESLKHLTLLEGLKGTRLVIPTAVMRELMDIEIQDTFLKTSTKKATLALNWVEECMESTKWWIHMDDEILLSPEAEPHVLETALLLREELTDQKVIILSNDLNLKIKAMSEGIMCEAAKEFHRSLVNPFSERFMWAGSLARGRTWSCLDDDILRQKYYGCSLNGPHMLKGLKLLARTTTFQ
uniref:uncharacterized protein LOC122589136 n=1 Tax=Erigeron canadensis TaxID=72917 RepID=UPI001CB89809|nr:uncharacterized protein LOC122589136 [Erigeron canadensis]